MLSLWRFVRNASNREVLAWCGGGIAVVAAGAWAIFVYFFPPDAKTSAASTTTTVTQLGTGIASGRDTTISGQVHIGLDEKKTSELFDAKLKSFEERVEALAREKGVPVAAIRKILIKLGEAGVSDEAIPQRLEAKADELIKLRKEIAQLRQGPAELASFAQRAQALIDQGDLDGARSALAEGSAEAHNLREQASRYEADFLAQEAKVDHLQLDYR